MARRKLSHRIGPPLAGLLGPALLGALGSTWRRRLHPPDLKEQAIRRGPAVYAFWHGRLLVPACLMRGFPATVMISRHADGEAIARIVERMGYRTVRGSSTRGGAAALLDAVRVVRSGGAMIFTPDGPKGPMERVHPGVVYAAARAGAPLFPVGVAMPGAKVLGSWDRFRIPRPFGRVAMALGPEMRFGDADTEGSALEAACARVEDAIRAADRAAEALWENALPPHATPS